MPGIAIALHDLLNDRSLEVEEAVTRHFTDTYRQRTDGVWDDRSGFVAHITHLRSIVAVATVSVLDEFSQQNSYADRHIARIVTTDGSIVVQEVYLFGERAEDGRFERIAGVTMMIEGHETDREIGSSR